jgi:hypothetical protein
MRCKLPLAENTAEPRYADAVLRDVAETEKAINSGTATIHETPDELFPNLPLNYTQARS